MCTVIDVISWPDVECEQAGKCRWVGRRYRGRRERGMDGMREKIGDVENLRMMAIC